MKTTGPNIDDQVLAELARFNSGLTPECLQHRILGTPARRNRGTWDVRMSMALDRLEALGQVRRLEPRCCAGRCCGVRYQLTAAAQGPPPPKSVAMRLQEDAADFMPDPPPAPGP